MDHWSEVEYTVLLLFPGFGTERENAESVVESALAWLNANKIKPGFRFAPPVSAHLEIVSSIDEAQTRIEEVDDVAIVIAHDVEEEERDAFLLDCQAQGISAAITVDAPRPEKRPLNFTLRAKPKEGISAHTLCAETLTAPVEEDEDMGDRVWEVIAVLALGVMQHHWNRNPR